MKDPEGPREKPKVFWWPLIFTLFMGFMFLDPWQRHASGREWALTFLGVAAFLGLYATAMAFWYVRPLALAAVAGVALLGFAFAPFNAGAALFIIYATSYVPYAVGGEVGPAVASIAVILTVVGVESWLLHLPGVFPTFSFAYALVLGTGNTYAARHAFRAERMAKADERERIARDLHDVLGHTLSLVILKAELAGRLLDRDLERAKAEIADVERISRETLAEVRRTIGGYLSGGLLAEMERASATLATAGIAARCRPAKVGTTPAQERVLALVLREAVTNVVRHSQAKACRLELEEVDGTCRLEIEDDGRGGSGEEGHGIRGMRERIEALGGTFSRDGHRGTRLTITLPLAARADGQTG